MHVTRRHEATRWLRADDGSTLALVIMISAILFLLVTVLLTVVVHQQMQTSHQVERETAMHLADAGINAYLYELRRNQNFFVSNPTLGPTSLENGTWQTWTQAPTEDKPLTLMSVGTLASSGDTRTITATVRFPTFADYMFVANTNINIGSAAVIDGKLRINGDINNRGRVTGKATASGRVTGSGIFEDGYEEGAPRVDFSQVTADLSDIRTVATADDTYFPPSGARGYRVVISGTWIDIDVITNVNSGNLITTNYDNVNIPASGVLYFDDDIWVSGQYDAKVTIASSSDIYIPNNLTVRDANSKNTAGLIASDSVIVPSWYPSLPQNMKVRAALLAQSGSIYAEDRGGYPMKASFTIDGSMSYNQYSYFSNGFYTRNYNYDPRLDFDPPPMYPQIRDGSLKVQTWFDG